MDKIYLVFYNKNFFVELNFILDNNYLEIEDEKYNFEIISFNQLRIFKGDFNKFFYTNDSFIYYENLILQKDFKKINLIHSEWYDNAVLNFKNNKIIRIKDRNQFGSFDYDDNDDTLIIDWNFWGVEYFTKIDDYNYKVENYKLAINKNADDIKNNNFNDIYIFIHVCSINNGFNIMIDQIKNIKETKLYEKCTKIYLSMLGEFNFNDSVFKDEKIEIIFYNKNIFIYEIETINKIKDFCDKLNNEAYILYIHTKGANNSGNNEVTKSWRKMMEYFLVNNYETCLNNLNFYDTLGNNLINDSCYNLNDVKVNDYHSKHYSGNFWWSKKSYISKLKNLEIDYSDNAKYTRYRAENWILSDNSCKIGVIFQDYTNTHPYHRYVFDNYKNEKILIKKMINLN